jgi:hypothetical protein
MLCIVVVVVVTRRCLIRRFIFTLRRYLILIR